MREILFRGFQESENGNEVIAINGRKIKGIWVYGYYCFNQKRCGAFGQTVSELDFDTYYIVSPRGGSYKVIPETVGQFTGLNDKNNKKIFEGDIVKGRFLYGREVLSVVAFKDGAFGLEWNRGDIKEFDAFTQMCNIEYEVIGNIFDKPEIL